MATLSGLAANAQDLIVVADAALYEAKRTGKNRVCVASEGRRAPADGRRPKAGAAKGPAPPRRT